MLQEVEQRYVHRDYEVKSNSEECLKCDFCSKPAKWAVDPWGHRTFASCDDHLIGGLRGCESSHCTVFPVTGVVH